MSEPFYIVVQDHPFETPVKPQGIPTPRLIELGRGDAYFVPLDSVDGQWRARDDKYDPPGTIYTRVRIIRNSTNQSRY